MHELRVTFLSLPDPPGIRIHREYAAGFGTVQGRDADTQTSSTLMPPVLSAQAAAVVEGMGHHASIVDAQAQGLDSEATIRSVLRTKPDVLITRTSLPCLGQDSKLIAAISQAATDLPIVAWGPVAKVLPDRILSIPGVKASILGELEFCLPQVVSALSCQSELSYLPGVATLGQSGVASGRSASPGPLDELPLPAHHLLEMSRYMTPGYKFRPGGGNQPEPFYTMLTSRGCNYGCSYCPYMVVYGHGWRSMGPERTVREIEELVSCHNVHNIWFLDEVFTQDYARAEQICNMILERDLDVAWRCESRVDRLPRKLVELMKRAGCGTVQIGVETGDPGLLAFGKPGSTIPKIEQTFRDLRDVGIQARASAMVGLPGESWQSVKMTEELLDRIDPVTVEISVSTPYPGTPFYDKAKKEGWIVDDDFSHYTITQPVTSFPGFSSRDIERARRYLLDRYLVRDRLRRSMTSAKRGRLVAFAKELHLGSLRESFWRIENLVRVRARL